MKNIEFPDTYYSEKFDIEIEPYIPSDLVVDIAETALTMENPMEQEICIAVNVLRECTDINVDDYLDNLDVDKILYTGLWDEVKSHIKNVHDIYIYIGKKEDVGVAIARFLNVTLPEFLDSISNKLDEYLDEQDLSEFIKDAPEKLNEILNTVKEDGNADIIRGAMKMGEVLDSTDKEKVDDAE